MARMAPPDDELACIQNSLADDTGTGHGLELNKTRGTIPQS
jgi:hypothetical protein